MQHSFLRFTALACIAALLTASFALQRTHHSSAQKHERSEAMDDPDGNMQWELKRMLDPSTGTIPDHIRRDELAFAATLPQAPELSRGMTFVNRGPYNVAGRTRAFAMDAANPNILLAGSVSGGIYRSTDGGQTWSNTIVPVFHKGFTSFAQDTRTGHTNTWYASSGEAYGQSATAGGAYYLGNGLYKSTDNGMSWDTIPSTNSNTIGFDQPYELCWNVKIDPSRMDSDLVYVATYGGIYRSANGGGSWKRVLGSFGGAHDAYFTFVNVTPTGKVYATLSSDGGPAKGIWRSTNGLQFTNISPSFIPDTCNRMMLAFAPSDENQIYIAANTPYSGIADTNYLGDVEWNSFWKYTYLTGDGAGSNGTWDDRTMNLPHTGGPFDKYTVQGSYDMVVTVKPNDPNYVVLGGTNLFASTDGFSTYNNIHRLGGYKIGANLPVVESYPNHHSDQHVAFFDPGNYNILYSSNDGGAYKTLDMNADTVQWQPLNNGYLSTQFYTIAIDNAATNDNVIIGGAQDYGTWFTNSSSPTAPWKHVYGGDGSFCAIADNKSAYYFSLQSGKTQRAVLDANGNTTSYARIDPRDGRNFQFINPFVLDPVAQNIMYMPANHKMWRNNNLAGIPMISNWDSITTNWITFTDTCTATEGNITAVACSVNPAHVLYYGTDTKRLFKVVNANTGNPTRQNITPNIFPLGYINCIAVDPLDANKIAVVFSNYTVMSLFNSNDGGATWIKSGGNLEQYQTGSGNGPSCRWLSIMHLQNGTLYFMATSTGLYATDTLQGAATLWVQQGASTIGNTVCDMVLTRATDGLVVVASHGNGIFSGNVTSIVQALGMSNLHASSLDVNVFPNPSFGNAQLMVNTTLHETVYADVCDMTGRKCSSLEFDPLFKSVAIPSTRLSSGVYYVHVRQGKSERTLKWVKD